MVLNFEFRFLKEKWEFGTKVLSRTRSPIFEQKVEVSYSVSPYIS